MEAIEPKDYVIVQGETNPWKARALKAEKQLEAVELLVLYTKDIVEMWPTVTLRTLWKVTDKVNSLKNILKELK